MELFKRKTVSESEIAETPTVAYPLETEEPKPERNRLMLASLVIAALAFAVLIVLAGRWAYHRWHSTSLQPASNALPAPPPKDLKPDHAGLPVAP